MDAITSAEAFAPASMGNVGVGFDILGLAFQGMGDTVTVERHNEPGIVIRVEGTNNIPLDPKKNTASVAIETFLKTIDVQIGIGITIRKGLPPGSGLGSSAASAVAAMKRNQESICRGENGSRNHRSLFQTISRTRASNPEKRKSP